MWRIIKEVCLIISVHSARMAGKMKLEFYDAKRVVIFHLAYKMLHGGMIRV